MNLYRTYDSGFSPIFLAKQQIGGRFSIELEAPSHGTRLEQYMSEMPFFDKPAHKSLWPLAAVILALVFAPAALAFLLNALHRDKLATNKHE